MGIRQVLIGVFLAASAAADTCKAIRSTTDIEVAAPSDPAYANRWYWNAQCTALEPTCVLLPASTKEVEQIVSVLKDSDEDFAVKSGGHNPNVYFASVGGGPLISTEKLNEVTLDEEAKTVRIGPGNRWGDVIGALDGTGYTVPGGRVGHVGVGGLLLGSESACIPPFPLPLTPHRRPQLPLRPARVGRQLRPRVRPRPPQRHRRHRLRHVQPRSVPRP